MQSVVYTIKLGRFFCGREGVLSDHFMVQNCVDMKYFVDITDTIVLSHLFFTLFIFFRTTCQSASMAWNGKNKWTIRVGGRK